MREFMLLFMNQLDFPEDAKKTLLDADSKLTADADCRRALDSLMDDLFLKRQPIREILAAVDQSALKLGIHPYTLQLVFFLYSAKQLLDQYRKTEIPDEIYWNSMLDLRCKLFECHDVYNVWGSFVGWWFQEFFTLERFGLGRLQFEHIPFSYDGYSKGGCSVRTGDTVINMHIPSAGPLTREKRLDSYRKAFQFYTKRDGLDGKPLAFVCHSWLLYPRNEDFYPKGSNIVDFMHDFDIIDSGEQDTFSDAWRVFGAKYQEPLEKLPTDTSLQRAYVNWLKAGNKTGQGYGIFFFDGEKIL